MLDAARITLADHRTYDLSGFYIVCTSNIGWTGFCVPLGFLSPHSNERSFPSFIDFFDRN